MSICKRLARSFLGENREKRLPGHEWLSQLSMPFFSKESGLRGPDFARLRRGGPGFGSTPGRGRSVTDLISTFYWSVGNPNTSQTFAGNQTRNRSDFIPLAPKNHRPLLHYSITPTLPGFFKAELSVSDLAQRTRISMFD
jgi:hypothetical protein